MKWILSIVMLLLASSTLWAQGGKNIVWHDLKTLDVEGRGWNNIDDFYRRLPSKAEHSVSDSVWWLSDDSSGMMARFITDSDQIKVRWKLKKPTLALNHMASTGVSGIDLYVKFKGAWRWLSIGRPTTQENEASLVSDLPSGKREYAIYLPLYNGVDSVEIGVSEKASFEKAAPRRKNLKPVVFYGSSITQGACASRPGMAYPSIIGRHLDVQTINLGFSGNGKCEHEVADLLAELDPQVYVIDCIPNMEAPYVEERIRYLLKVLNEKHPKTPVILVEQVVYQYTFINNEKPENAEPKNIILRKIFADVQPQWNGRLHYIKCDRLYGADGEASVDGVHATDVGFLRMVDVIEPIVHKALKESEK